MLAHDGISNEELWTQYLQLNSAIHLLVYIKSSSANQLAVSDINDASSSKQRRPRLASNLCCDMATSWGDKSLVLVTKQLLIEALELYPSATHFQLVSGTCVPIVHANTIVKWATTNRKQPSVFEIGETQCSNFVIVDNKFMANKTRFRDHVRFPTLDTDWPFSKKPRIIKFHSQWCILNATDAKTLSTFDFSAFDDIDANFGDRNKHQILRIREQDAEYRSTKKRIVVLPPDEYYLMLALEMVAHVSGNKYSCQRGLVSFYIERNHKAAGPIEWQELDQMELTSISLAPHLDKDVQSFLSAKQLLYGLHQFLRTSKANDVKSLFVARKFVQGCLQDLKQPPWIIPADVDTFLPIEQVSDSSQAIQSTGLYQINELRHNNELSVGQEKNARSTLNLATIPGIKNPLKAFAANVKSGSKFQKTNHEKRRKKRLKAKCEHMRLKRSEAQKDKDVQEAADILTHLIRK